MHAWIVRWSTDVDDFAIKAILAFFIRSLLVQILLEFSDNSADTISGLPEKRVPFVISDRIL